MSSQSVFWTFLYAVFSDMFNMSYTSQLLFQIYLSCFIQQVIYLSVFQTSLYCCIQWRIQYVIYLSVSFPNTFILLYSICHIYTSHSVFRTSLYCCIQWHIQYVIYLSVFLICLSCFTDCHPQLQSVWVSVREAAWVPQHPAVLHQGPSQTGESPRPVPHHHPHFLSASKGSSHHKQHSLPSGKAALYVCWVDFRRERIPLLWSTMGETALARGFCSNTGDTKYPRVCAEERSCLEGVYTVRSEK